MTERTRWRAALAGALAWFGVVMPAQAGFYDAEPALIPGEHGTLIRYEPLSAPPGSSAAYRILYRSRGLKREPIAVSGVVVLPAAAAPPGGRPVVAWAHPTTGVARRCAPSLSPACSIAWLGCPACWRRASWSWQATIPGSAPRACIPT